MRSNPVFRHHARYHPAPPVLLLLLLLLSSCGIVAPNGSPQPSAALPTKSPVASATAGISHDLGAQIGLVGHAGGEPADIAVAGDYAYAAIGIELAVFDLSNPRQPDRVGYVVLPVSIQRIIAAEQTVYAVGGYTLWVIDAADPTAPHIVGRYQNTHYEESPGADDLIIAGSSLFWTNGTMLKLIDVARPEQPVERANYPFPPTPQGVRRMALAGDILYGVAPSGASDASSALLVFDVGDPQTLREIARLQVPANDIAIGGAYGYLAADDGLRVLDLSRPAQPVVLQHVRIPTMRFIDALTLADGTLVVAGTAMVDGPTYRVQVLDLADPARPAEQGAVALADYRMLGAPAMRAGIVYVVGWGSITTLDFRDPTAAHVAGAYRPLPRLSLLAETPILATHGTTLYATSLAGLQVIDASDPADLRATNVYTAAGYGGVAANETTLALFEPMGPSEPGLHLLDIAVPTRPTPLTTIPLRAGEGPFLTMRSTTLYLASPSGFRAFALDDPLQPREVAHFTEAGDRRLLAVAGAYAFVGGPGAETLIVSITNPSMPTIVGTLPPASSVVARGSYAYLLITNASGPSTLQVVDLTNPAQARIVSEHALELVYPGPLALIDDVLVVTAASGSVLYRLDAPAMPAEVMRVPLIILGPAAVHNLLVLPVMEQRDLLVITARDAGHVTTGR